MATTVKDLSKAIEKISRRHDLWKVWCDFTQMAATAIANAVDHRPVVWQTREDAYLKTVKDYTKDEMTALCHALGMVVDGLDIDQPGDLLGQVYMNLELGNKWAGQFFTPDALCRVMGRSMFDTDEIKERISKQGFVTVSEPSVGGGATIIGLANAMRESDVNYQQCMRVTAVDVDIKSVYMAYIQFSLLHIPAVVIHGNTLTLEEWSHWYTPAHIIDGWGYKLSNKDNPQPDPPPRAHIDMSKAQQMDLL